MHCGVYRYYTADKGTLEVGACWFILSQRRKLTCPSARPIFTTFDTLCGLNARTLPPATGVAGLSSVSRGLLRGAIRIVIIFVILLVAILVPSFDSVMALMGSAMCFTICIILPVAFHLSLFRDQIGRKEKILNWALIVVCSIMTIVGTVWVFLPSSMTGAIRG